MFGNLFTSDYEIHGNGDGCPYELMVEPTDRMLQLFDRFGAKLTIMADVGEILKFKEYYLETGVDKFHYKDIIEQLQRALKTGHDVQLHIHSSYFGSNYNGTRWEQNWLEYSLAELPYPRLQEIIGICKNFLEEELRPHIPDYRCFAFRAANWSMSPSTNIIKALIEHGITIDTSVWKYGTWDKIVKFDYTHAHSDLIPWVADKDDICKLDPNGTLVEIPIYCERQPIWHFITENRLYRLRQASKHQHPSTKFGYDASSDNQSPKKSKIKKLVNTITQKHAWKMDFNQCSGRQLVGALKRIEKKYGSMDRNLPVVMIGHSKIFTKANARSLERFLGYVQENPHKHYFATFSDFDLESFRN